MSKSIVRKEKLLPSVKKTKSKQNTSLMRISIGIKIAIED
jgi:hypothetical protein